MKVVDLNNLSIQNIIKLNEISVSIIEDFNDLIKEIFLLKKQKIAWLVSSIVSRHTYQSNLFLNCCYLILLKELIETEKDIVKIRKIDGIEAKFMAANTNIYAVGYEAKVGDENSLVKKVSIP